MRYEPQNDVEKRADSFLSLMTDNIFWPAPAVLLGGNEAHPVLFTATAMPLSDSFDEIFSTLKRTSIYLQNGIQVALDFSGLRAARSAIGTGPWQSVGPVRFMEAFERAPQGAGSRTPLRFFLNITHQDIHEYLEYMLGAPSHVRFALGLTPEFLSALENGGRIRLYHRPQGEAGVEVAAAEIFKGVARVLAKGIPIDLMFLDSVQLFRSQHQIADECILSPHNQFVYPGELTAGGALNLTAFFAGGAMDEIALKQALDTAVVFLDNCFERCFYPDESLRAITCQKRRIALSVLGIDDVLNKMDPSGHLLSRKRLTAKIAAHLQKASLRASHDLGRRRGLKNRIYFQGQWHETRHSQVLAQTPINLIPQIANVPPYLLRREMGLKDFRSLYPLHVLWQESLGNIASLRHPLKGLDLTTLTQLVLETHNLRLPVFEMA